MTNPLRLHRQLLLYRIMNKSDLGGITAYGHAIDGGYLGSWEEWYNLFFAVASGAKTAPYDTMAERPQINGIVISGVKPITGYDIYDRYGGSYFRISGDAGDDIEINGIYRGTLGDNGKALIGGVIDVGKTIIKIGGTTKEIDTPYFGLYRVSK